MMTRLLPLTILALSACATPELRVAPAADVPVAETMQSRFERIEIVEISLPSYAESEEIYAASADGTLAPLGPLWDDTPARGLRLDLADALAGLTGALVAPDPWPYRDPADVRIDIRVSSFFVTDTGALRLYGRVFSAPEFEGRDSAHRFEIEIPAAQGAASLAAARAEATAELARFIARESLR